jgi:hypothetical protein
LQPALMDIERRIKIMHAAPTRISDAGGQYHIVGYRLPGEQRNVLFSTSKPRRIPERLFQRATGDKR